MSKIKNKIQEIADEKGIEFEDVSQEMFLECLIQEEKKIVFSRSTNFTGWVKSLKSLFELNSNLRKLKKEIKSNTISSKNSVYLY